jgi:alkylhydroperoxidase family enzyme
MTEPTPRRSIDEVTQGRLPAIPPDSDDPRLQPVFDVFRSQGIDPPVIHRTLANAPEMLSAWVGLAWPLRQATTVGRGLQELAIMRVGQLTNAEGEWTAHWDPAIANGVTESQLTELWTWRTSDEFDDRQRAVLAFTDELTTDLVVSDETFGRLQELFDPGEIVELALTAAFYSCVSRILLGLGFTAIDPDDPRLAHMRAGTHQSANNEEQP